MRCDYCPLSAPEDVCPEAEGKYGIEHKDGMLGCSHPWNWVKKRDKYRSNVAQATLQNARTTDIKNKSQKLNNLIEAAEKLAVKLNEALDDPEQLYRQILRTSSGAESVRITKKLDTRALKDFASTISTMNDTIKQLNDLTEDEDKKNVEIKIIEGKKEWAQ